MNFTTLTAEQRRSFDAETVAYFQALTGLFPYFSLQLGDAVWRGKNVLDFGGSIGSILRDPGSTIDEERYWCLDVNREAIERGEAAYPKAHWVFYNRYCFEFNPHGIPNLSIPDLRQTFDYIIAYSVFTNNTETDMLQLVNQLEGMLAPGGALAFTFNDPFHFISSGQSNFQWRLDLELEKGKITADEMKDLAGRARGAASRAERGRPVRPGGCSSDRGRSSAAGCPISNSSRKLYLLRRYASAIHDGVH